VGSDSLKPINLAGKDYFTAEEAAEYAGMFYAKWRSIVLPRFPPGLFLGKAIYRRRDVQRFIEENSSWPEPSEDDDILQEPLRNAPLTSLSPMLDLDEAAALTKCHRDTLCTLARERKVPSTKVGRKWVFPRDLLQVWIKERCQSPVRQAGIGTVQQTLAERLRVSREQRIRDGVLPTTARYRPIDGKFRSRRSKRFGSD
jgi:excisionase family DNA binding protein